MNRGTHLWFNGQIRPVAETQISLFTHALHYGMGAFEGIRAYQQVDGRGAIFRLHDHLVRLLDTCKILDLKVPYSLEQLTQAALAVCQANQFLECYLRPIVFIGDGPLGLHPGKEPPIDVAILSWKWGHYLGAEGVRKGARLKISSFIRPHVNSSMTKGKITGQYVNGVLAKREAVSLGYDEALLLDPEGYLTEGSGENLFIVKNGVLKTTPLNSILNGLTRQTVLDYCKFKKIEVQEARFTRDEIWCADEVFLTGTAAEITPIRDIDHCTIGASCPGPITAQLQKSFHQMVRGEMPEFTQSWLTPIPSLSLALQQTAAPPTASLTTTTTGTLVGAPLVRSQEIGL